MLKFPSNTGKHTISYLLFSMLINYDFTGA